MTRRRVRADAREEKNKNPTWILFTGLAESRHTSQRCYVNPFCGSAGSCLQPDDVPRVTSFQSALVLREASADICNFSWLLRVTSQKQL